MTLEREGDFMKNDDKLTSFLAVVVVIAVVLFIGWIGSSDEEETCVKYGCDRAVSEGNRYCYLHKSSRSSWSSSGGSTSKYSSGSSSKSSSSSSTSGSTKNSSASSSSQKSSSSGSSWKSYDEGYDAIYEDDDYDWDRYWSDSDYADGVDDAMEDVEW